MTNHAEVDDIESEWLDRYGPLPAPAQALLRIGHLRAECARLGIREVAVVSGGAGLSGGGFTARLSPLELKASQKVRLGRLAPKAVFKEDIGQLVDVAAPGLGSGRRSGRLAGAVGPAGSIGGAVKPSLRILAGTLALAGLSLSLTACDTSPYAAQVNSEVIKETALNSEIRAWAGNPTYVASYDSANSTQNGGSGTSVVGAAAGTYSLPWVAMILSGMIEARIIHQHLNAAGDAPRPGHPERGPIRERDQRAGVDGVLSRLP